MHIYSFLMSALLETGCVRTLERHKEHSLKDKHTHNIQHISAKWTLPEESGAIHKQYAESQHRERKRRGQARGGRACRSFKRQG